MQGSDFERGDMRKKKLKVLKEFPGVSVGEELAGVRILISHLGPLGKDVPINQLIEDGWVEELNV